MPQSPPPSPKCVGWDVKPYSTKACHLFRSKPTASSGSAECCKHCCNKYAAISSKTCEPRCHTVEMHASAVHSLYIGYMTLTSNLENLFINSHLHGEYAYLLQVSQKCLQYRQNDIASRERDVHGNHKKHHGQISHFLKPCKN